MFHLRNVLVLASLLTQVTALPTTVSPVETFKQCQRITSEPLEGCPPGTLYVSQSDERAQFQTVQSAIASIPNSTTPYVILIAPGIYYEQLNVTRRGPLTLLGMSDRPWRGETYADLSSNGHRYNNWSEPEPANAVQVHWNSANHDASFGDNAYTAVLTVGPNLNATLTGSGPTGFPVPADTPFGCADFRAYNVDFRNHYAPYGDGPSLTVSVSRANAGFYSCGFYSWQDTVYIGKLGNAYFYDAVIAGQTDFLYGFGTLWAASSQLLLRGCGGGVIAWKGTNTSFANAYGAYVADSSVRACNASVAREVAGACALGRPWNAAHRSVYLRAFFDASVRPAGYEAWAGDPDGNIGPNTTMAVYDVYGPGHDEAAERASNVTMVWGSAEVRPYRTPEDVFMTPEGRRPNVGWIDPEALRAAGGAARRGQRERALIGWA
ncbi:pectin methylesterase family protein [Xylariaceae sp. FL0804]|nr:pectin methylesterase family protein [Xylariaceae sp. FL0804]